VIPIVALTLLAIAFLLFLIQQVRGRFTPPIDPGPGEVLPAVDLEAFRNLTDPAEEMFLRQNLSSRDFRKVQRMRLRAATLYVSALSQNVGALVQVGQRARIHPDPRIAASGHEIMQYGLRLKARCLATQWKLSIAMLCPTLLSPSGSLADRYVQVADLANALQAERVA
jgi:hypothetical protein